MKRALLYLFFSVFISNSTFAEGIVFQDASWDEVVKMANEKDQMIFVDAYTTWCGPCKRLAKNVFPQAEVGDYFNTHFINVKMNMESPEGRKFGKKYPVSSYPTLLFLDQDGELVHKLVGACDVTTLIKQGAMAIRKNDRSDIYAQKYEDGDRSYDLVMKYIKALNSAGKSSLKVSNDFYKSNIDMSMEEKSWFLAAAVTEADSKLYDALVEEKKQIASIIGQEKMTEVVENACITTVHKAIEYEVVELLQEAKEKMKDYDKKQSKAFAIRADMIYAQGTGNIKGYLDNAEKYSKKVIKDDPEELMKLAGELYKNDGKAPAYRKLIDQMVNQSFENEKSVESYDMKIRLMVDDGDMDKAMELAQEALTWSKENNLPNTNFLRIIKYLESKQK